MPTPNILCDKQSKSGKQNKNKFMNIEIRPGRECERRDIAQCIAEGFERDFSFFCKDADRVVAALLPGIHPTRFFVAAQGEIIKGVAGLSDCTGRALSTTYGSYCKNFGWLKGTFAKLILKKEFDEPLLYPPTTGFIEFVAIRKIFRRQGIASLLLKESMKQAGYKEYILNVIDENTPALKCYTQLGFQSFKKIKKGNGYTKNYMKLYSKTTSTPYHD